MGFFDFLEKDEKNNTQSADKNIIVVKQRCPQNHACPSVRVCPVDALKQNGYNAPEVDLDKCIKCLKCVKSCPMGAIALK